MDIKIWLTLVISFGALLFSFLNFKRSKRLDSENHLYKLKIDIYSKTLSELYKLINGLQDHLQDAEFHFKNPSDEGNLLLNKQADEVEKLCFDFYDSVVTNSLIIPETVLTPLYEFSSMAIDSDPLTENIKDRDAAFTKLEKVVDILIDKADEINIFLRKDLQIDELNTSLYRRLKK